MGTTSSVERFTGSQRKVSRFSNRKTMNSQKKQVSPQNTKTDTSNNELRKKGYTVIPQIAKTDTSTNDLRKTESSRDEEEKIKKDKIESTDNDPEISENDGENMEETEEQAEDADNTDGESKKPKVKKPPLTKEEIEVKKKNLIEKVETHIETMKDKEWLDENCRYVEGARKLLLSFETSYFALKTAPLSDIIESRRHIADAVLKTDILTKVCGVVIDVYPRGWANEENKTDLNVFSPFKNALLIILNFSDASADFAERVSNIPGFMEMIHKILAESAEPHLKQEQKVNRYKVMKWALSIAHNISMIESNVPRLRSLNFTEVLEPYLKSPEKFVQLICLASLAGIIDEKESEMLNSNSGCVKYLMKVLRKGLDSPKRRYEGLSCKECALTVKQLARNDTNKKLLVELGALELLVELARGSTEEQIEAVGAIWALSFDEENRKIMVENEELGVITTLLNLKSTGEHKIKAAANGALWNLRADLAKSEMFRELGEALSDTGHKKGKDKTSVQGGLTTKEAESEKDEVGHIMISYQWSSQKTMIEVRDILTENGFKVWMDIDQMGGSTLQAMADAVENASIFLMCMSQKYKDSPNCRAEAEYAFQQRKKIVPLMLQRGYKPDGWLGFILGAKLFYDFSGKYPFEDKMRELLKELRKILGQSQGVPNEKVVPKKTEVNYHQPKVADRTDSSHPGPVAPRGTPNIVDNIRKWTADDVKNWINKNNLSVEKFGHLTGGEVAALVTMRQEAPETFYLCLKEMLKITDLLTLSQLLWALNDIGK